MLRKAVFLFIAWYVIAVVLSGCCNCPEPAALRFRWTSLDIAVYPYSVASGYVITSPDTATDFTARNPFFLTELNYELMAKGHDCPSLLGQAYACKCSEDYFVPETNLSELRVYTVHAYDSTHPAMSDVTEYFGEFSNIPPDTILQPLQPVQPFPAYGSAHKGAVMYLGKRPAFKGYHQFRVVYTLADSSMISAITSPLLF